MISRLLPQIASCGESICY